MQNKPNPDRNSRLRAMEWYAVAAALRPKVDKIARGKREQGLGALAADHGIKSIDTLRRMVAAAAFLDRLDQTATGQGAALRSAPVAAVELIARWFAYDEEAAIKAAKDLARRFYTVVKLRSAERDARLASKATRKGRSGAHLLRQRIAPKIKELIEATGLTYTADLPGPFDAKRVDFVFQASDRPGDRIAVCIFGPFGNERLYMEKLEDFLVKLLGLSRMYSKVVGIFPIPERWDARSWRSFLDGWRMRYHRLNITLYDLDLKTLELISPLPIETLHP